MAIKVKSQSDVKHSEQLNFREEPGGNVRHWDMQGHGDDITGLSFSPDSAIVVSSSRDCSLRVWQVSAGTPTTHPLVSNVHRCVSFQNRLRKSSEPQQTKKVSRCK